MRLAWQPPARRSSAREFKHFFGNRPMEQAKRIRESFGAARTLQIAPSPLVVGDEARTTTFR